MSFDGPKCRLNAPSDLPCRVDSALHKSISAPDDGAMPRIDAQESQMQSPWDATEEEFSRLYSRKDEIEQAVGDPLDWDDRSGRDGFTVSLRYQKPFDVRSKDERWQDAQKWLIDAMVRMREAFNGKLDGAG